MHSLKPEWIGTQDQLIDVADSRRRDGRMAEAESLYRRALEADSGNLRARFGLGLVLRDTDRVADAFNLFYSLHRGANGPLEATIEAARIGFATGRVDDAMSWLRKAAAAYPDRHEPHVWLGAMFAQAGRPAEAAAAFRASLARSPRDADSLRGLVFALFDTGQFAAAEQPATLLREIAPEDPLAHTLISSVYAETGRPAEAVAAAEQALTHNPNEVGALLQLARGLMATGRHEDAIAILTRAKRVDPSVAVTGLYLAQALKVSGYLDSARSQLFEVIERDPNQVTAYSELADIYDFPPDDPRITAMETLLTRVNKTDDRRKLRFALGKAYDDAGDPPNAFAQFQAANELERQAFPYNEELTLARLDRIAKIFTGEFIQTLAGGGAQSPAPIFIVGIPRSGTTLVEQILASHSQVAAAGEVDLLMPAARSVLSGDGEPESYPDLASLTKEEALRIGEEYLRRLAEHSNGKARVTDKQLSNRRLLGLIHLALPQAKIIHCIRNPLDACLSGFMKPIGATVPYASDLGTLGRYYRHTHSLMAHWRKVLPPGTILDVRYEDVVADIGTQARRIAAFCGLEWEDRCLAFHQTRRPVNTASMAQVRKPIYKTAVGRWEAYASFLAPLILALGDLAQLPPL